MLRVWFSVALLQKCAGDKADKSEDGQPSPDLGTSAKPATTAQACITLLALSRQCCCKERPGRERAGTT